MDETLFFEEHLCAVNLLIDCFILWFLIKAVIIV